MPPVPIREICFLNGLSVKPHSNLKYGDRKLVGMLDTLNQAVYFEETDILGRQNFTIAHELGHYILHWLPNKNKASTAFIDENDPHFFRDTTEEIDETAELNQTTAYHKLIESEANYFARFILMPTTLITQAAIQLIGRLYNTAKKILAQQFEVSEAAMDYRLKTLGLYKNFMEESRPRKSIAVVRNLGSPKVDSAKQSILMTPETRLRALIDQVKSLHPPVETLELDFSRYSRAEVGSIGCVQALDIVLFQEYLERNMFSGSSKPVQYHISSPHVIRHLDRLGVLDYLSLETNRGDSSSPTKDTVTGNRVLAKLMLVERNFDSSEIKQRSKASLLSWDTQPNRLADFAQFVGDLVEKTVLEINRHAPLKAYFITQASRVVKNDVISGYRVICASGFYIDEIGYSNGIASYQSPLDIIQSHIGTDYMEWLRGEVIHKWQGIVQINHQDATINIGKMDTSYLSGLYQIPFFQIILLANRNL